MAGIMTLPLIAGLALSSTVAGQIITRTGRWKIFLVIGGICLTAGIALARHAARIDTRLLATRDLHVRSSARASA